ncbi:hypothetical protein CH063_15714 [Colletotrichum higginsianum]|uniref:Uncharacterized protein n=1 Tax=Colletotrichum higginsianum (strain IMI 349063) TaxID=759273 RepID=H1W437_COLHI|nr:hypothetical protein CH063_15714 [Colletotrichum higginsianum]
MCSWAIKSSLYGTGRDMKVPPMMMYSTLSTEWPRDLSWSTRPRACSNGSYRARIARIDVGSYPV